MEVLYHIRQYFVGIFPYINLTKALYMEDTSNQSVPGMAIDLIELQLTLGIIIHGEVSPIKGGI